MIFLSVEHFLRIADENSNKYYKAKIVQVNDVEQTLWTNYVGRGNASNEISSVMSSRIEAWSADDGFEVADGGPC